MIVLEIFVLRFGENRRREGAKPFAMLDAGVEHIFHVGQAGMRHDRTIAERARSPFHAALEPSDHVPLHHFVRTTASRSGSRSSRWYFTPADFERCFDLRVRKIQGPGKRDSCVRCVVVGRYGMISMQRGADCQAFVPGGGLNPGAAEGSSGKYFSVGNAVEGATSGHREILVRHALMQIIQRDGRILLRTSAASRRRDPCRAA